MRVQKAIFAASACFIWLILSATEGYANTITASAGAGGSITPSGAVWVPAGSDKTFTITPGNGVLDVVVDGSSVGAVSTYTFSNVTADHSITASFVCDNPPVMLEYDHSYFDTITDAHTSAIAGSLNDFTLLLMAGTLNAQDLHINAPNASVVVRGGYDCSFLDDTMVTIIPGSLTVAAGTATVSNLVLSPAPRCDGNDPNNFPGNPESCDGLDNNCNGLIDDGLSFDADGDGATAIGSCAGSADDCDDNDPNNLPGNPESCDGRDNNCNGQIDEGLLPVDADGDGFTAIASCGGSRDDCNDGNGSIHPGASETYGDSIDQDCNGNDVLLADTACFTCHNMTNINMYAHDAPDATCVDCHPARVSGVLSGHYGKTVRTAGNNMAVGSVITCTSCHDIHPDPDYHIEGTNFVWAKVTAAGSSVTCDTCHELRAAMHVSDTAHNNRIIDNLCGQCHTGDTTVLGSPGSGTLTTEADVDALHRSDCNLCHNYSGTKLDAVLVRQAIQNGFGGAPIACTTCHGASFPTIHAFIGNHSALVRVGTTICGNCHSDSPPLVDATDPKVHSACTNCHDVNGNRVSLAIGKTFAAGGDCTTCHGNHFPNHSHHSGADNEVSYDAAVDTSQTSEQGCAVCHHDNDTANGTTQGLSPWEAILVEHDLDGTKDGSANTCERCHAYDGGSSAPLAAVQNAIASGNPATCATCHTDKAPNVDHGIPTNGKHSAHLALPGVSCGNCHSTGNYPYFKSGTDSNGDGLYNRAETDVCAACHQDGTGSPATGFKEGWDDPAFELNCSGCHTGAPGTGSHTIHVSLTGCGSCHDGTIPNATAPAQHVDQNIDVYDATPLDLGYPADKAIGSTYATCSTTYCHSTAQGVTNPTAPPTYVTSPAWGTPFAGTVATCTGCHASGGHVGDAGSPLTSGSHAKHLNFRFDQEATCNACHFDWSYTGCSSCHQRQVNHANNSIDVMFNPEFPLTAASSSGAYTGDPAPRTPYGTCSSLYCHSPGTKASAPYDEPNVTNISWGGSGMPADCTGCHDGDSATAQPMATGSHGVHIANYDCSKCHVRTVDNSRALNSTLYTPKNYSYGQRYHVDGWVTVAFSSDTATSGSYAGAASPTVYRAPGSAAGSCANTYCHSNGTSVATTVVPSNTSPVWGSAVALSCAGCHSYPPSYANGTPKANSHAAHGSFSCDTCHFSTTTTGDTITNPANHANRIYNVQAGSGVSFTYTAAPTGGSCATVSCHGGSTATWSWGAVANHTAALGSGEIDMGFGENNIDHPPGFTITEECSLCHYANLPAQHANLCTLCHAASGGPPAGLQGPWNQTCQACHPSLHSGMGADHNGMYWDSSVSCSLCHDDSGEFPGPGDNCTRCHNPGFTVASVGDHQPPTTTTDVVGLFIGPATIHLTATDAGTSGVSLTRYSLDGKPWKLGNLVYVSAPTSGSKAHTLQFYSADHAMNIEAVQTVNFTVQAP